MPTRTAHYVKRSTSPDRCIAAIQVYLSATGMSQGDLAEKVGFHRNFIWNLRNAVSVSTKTERAFFEYIDGNWPNQVRKHRIIVDFFADVSVARKSELRNQARRRPCMKCREDFNSEGHHNRLCASCCQKVSRLGAEFA